MHKLTADNLKTNNRADFLTNQLMHMAESLSEANFGLLAENSLSKSMLITPQLKAFIEYLPGSVFIEDVDCNFLLINNYGSKRIVGLKNSQDIKNKSHEELSKMGTWHVSDDDISAWKDAKSCVMYDEKPIIANSFSPYLIANNSLIFQVGNIFPLYNHKDKVTGSFTIALDVTSQVMPEAICRAYHALYSDKNKAHRQCLKHLFGDRYNLFQDITARELDCLIYLSCGYSTKQIAAFLKLSTKSIENYTATIKEKLQVEHKSSLIGII